MGTALIRLDRLLSNRGYCARSQVGSFLERVEVEGRPATSGATRVNPDLVRVDGEPIDPEFLVLLLHKPAGYTCSHKEAGPLVFELLPGRVRARNPVLSTVGRLDKDTTGALLLTDHGQLLHRLIAPRFKMPKLYEVELQQPLSEAAEQTLLSGGLLLEGDDKPLLPAGLERLGELHILLELHEGRYHQIKRSLAALGAPVARLHRRSFAGLGLEGLDEGCHRRLEGAELAHLLDSVNLS